MAVGAKHQWTLLVGCALAATAALLAGQGSHAEAQAPRARAKCDTAGLTLPPGFCATVFADEVGHARHMVAAPDGTLFVNTWSGSFFRDTPPPEQRKIVVLKDTDGDGKADKVARFGGSAAEGAIGGTGIQIYKGMLYAEEKDRILRWRIDPATGLPTGAPETVLTDLPMSGDHVMHPFVIAADGSLFVNSGSASNTCEKANRQPESPGIDPCTELETRAGIWRYDANKLNQKFTPAERHATGIRNTGGMAFDAAGRMFATQHGRDQLSGWPKLYTQAQNAELPAEELMLVTKGGDYGWPYCYFDPAQNKLVLAPEYGGDGGKAIGRCAGKTPPVAAFPAHWAPNDVTVYQGKSFPAAYRGGAFIAFHGSWNRAPMPQGGFKIVFQPLKDGKAAGKYQVFADGFAGPNVNAAQHRPAGLAVGPDGALYVSDDAKGRIWRISFGGGRAAAAAPTQATKTAAAVAAAPVPPGSSAAQVALGGRIFRGEEAGGTCAGCHGAAGEGSPVGPPLDGKSWLWSDGSVGSLRTLIMNGVPKPKRYTGAMPPKGGSPFSNAQVDAVAAYVWTLSHRR